MQGEDLFIFVFVVGIIAGVIVILMAMRQRSLQLEMQHRERMAMIERGQVPVDLPAVHRLGGVQPHLIRRPATGSRSMSLGIIVTALGLGVMTIISVAGGSPEIGVGIGGAIVILGVAFITNSLVSRNDVSAPAPPPQPDDRT